MRVPNHCEGYSRDTLFTVFSTGMINYVKAYAVPLAVLPW
jgi:hypothetical protein